jgi:hypothetical protein
LLKRDISRFSASLCLAAALAALAGCGSGQAPAGPAAPPVVDPITGPAVSTIQLLASNTQIPSSGATTVDLTAVVLSSTKQTLSGKKVTFSTGTDSTAFVNNVSTSGVSDANGVVTAKLNLGANKTNRTIAVSAMADAATASNNIDVTGTTVSISGNSSLAFTASTELNISVKDSAGIPLSGALVSVTSVNGNTIDLTPATGITGSSGVVTATVTPAVGGDDTIKVSSAGASAEQLLTISSADFTLALSDPTSTAACTNGIAKSPPEITLTPDTCGAPAVTASWSEDGNPQENLAVTFSVSRGTVAGSPSNTTAGKTSGVTVSSNSAGPAIITASGPGGTPSASLNVIFVATTADNVAVQAVPGTVQVDLGVGDTQTSKFSEISVIVRDIANNLVKNAGVDFTIKNDPSGGELISARAVTDVNGKASVNYSAGAASSPANGVEIEARVTDINGSAIAQVTGTATLTVAGQSLLVRLGTDNLVADSPPVNIKTYAAVVTDAAGNASADTTVRFSLKPARYWKGFYTFDAIAGVWVQTITAQCENEDTNFNGNRDLPGAVVNGDIVLVDEDNNLNGSLDPGNVASVTASGVTDASGIATATITYPKDRSTWVEQILEGRTGVSTNDPPATVAFVLPGVATDYTDRSKPPPGVLSPYGTGTSCDDTD